MEKPSDLETKYQTLAIEYSKFRSQVTVLKKAVLDEQAKNLELRDIIKKNEQKIRKHDQEMESLIFRNEQLTKRISVLQQDLQQENNHSKKMKNKNVENTVMVMSTDLSVLDEELQKKILENAQLVSSMADKDFELNDHKERISWLESQNANLERQLRENETKFLEESKRLKQDKLEAAKKLEEISNIELLNNFSANKTEIVTEQTNYWKEEADRWRSECEVLRSKPESNEQLTDYYESQIRDILETKQLSQSETKSLWAENTALYNRLENLITTKRDLEHDLETKNEELQTTTLNYKAQLDAMTEHLAAQNDKITKQCDEIQFLRHKLSTKK